MSLLPFCPVLRPTGHTPGLSAPSKFLQKKKLFLELWTGTAWAIQLFLYGFQSSTERLQQDPRMCTGSSERPLSQADPSWPLQGSRMRSGSLLWARPRVVTQTWTRTPPAGWGAARTRLRRHYNMRECMVYGVSRRKSDLSVGFLYINWCHFHWHDALSIC